MSKKFFLSLGLVALLFSNSQAIDENLIKAVQAEGRVNSLAMLDTWADLKNLYGVEHSDTDTSSAQEIAKFKAENKNASGDIGASFGEIVVKQEVAQPFKTSYWDQIPTRAKDKDGNWLLAYTGTIAFIVNKDVVKDIPKTWQDLLKGNYKITVGDVSIANLKKGEVEAGLVWDFNGLGYRDKVGKDRYEVLTPVDGSVISGYTTIINKYAKHPNAAKLARELYFLIKDKSI